MMDAESVRQAKLLNARKKLKKFQSKRLDQSDNNSETSSVKTSHENHQENIESINNEPTSPIRQQRQENMPNNMNIPSNTLPSVTSPLMNLTSPTTVPTSITTTMKSPPLSARSPALPPPSAISMGSPPPIVARSPPFSHSYPHPAYPSTTTKSPPVSAIVSPLLLSQQQQPLNMVQSASAITSPRYMELQNKSQTLEHEKSLLSQQVHKLEYDYVSLKSQFDTIHFENNERLINYQQKLQEALNYQQSLEYERDQLKQSLSDHNAILQKNENQVHELQSFLKAANEKSISLNKKIEELESQQQQQQQLHDTSLLVQNDDILQKIQNENDSFKQQINELKANNDDFLNEQTRLIDMVNDLEEELAKTMADNHTKGREIETLTEKLNDSINNNNNNNTGVGEHTIERSISQSSSISSSIFNQSEEMIKIKNEIHQLAQERNNHLKLIDDMEKKFSDKQKELQEAHHEVEELRSELENKKKENDDYIQQYNHKNKEAIDLLEKLQLKEKDITAHTEKLAHVEREYENKFKNHNEVWETKLNTSHSENDQKYNQLEKRYLEQQTRLNELKYELEKSNDVIELKNQDINGFKTDKEKLNHDQEQLKVQFDQLQNEIKKKQHQMDQMTETINQLKQERDTFDHQLNETKKQIEVLESNLEKKDETIKKSIDKNLFIQHTLKEKVELYDKLMNSKRELEQQLQTIIEQNEKNRAEEQLVLANKTHKIVEQVARVSSMLDGVEKKIDTKVIENEKYIGDLKNKLIQYETLLEEKNKELEEKNKELETKLQELIITKQSINSIQDQVQNKSTEIESKSLEQQLYISKLESEKLSFEEQKRHFEEELTLKDDEINEKQELVELLEEARASLLEERNMLKAQCEQYNLNANNNNNNNTMFNANPNNNNNTFVLENQLSEKNTLIHSLESKLIELEKKFVLEKSSKEELLHQQFNNNQLTSLQDELTQLKVKNEEQVKLYDTKITELSLSIEKNNDLEHLLEQARYQWMTEQSKVTTLTEEVSQLQHQIQAYSTDQQKLRRQLDETRQLLANNDQNKEALQWQVTDMESSVQLELDMLNRELKDTQQQLLEKSLEAEQLQQKLSLATTTSLSSLSISGATDEYENISNTSPKTSSISSAIQTEQSNDHHHQKQHEEKEEDVEKEKEEEKDDKEETNVKLTELENENKELKLRLERQFDAFTTIRGELTTVRERQLNAELDFDKEREQLNNKSKDMEQIIERLKNEYQEHLERMWQQHESIRRHHEEDLTLGRDALDAAQVKLMQNGLSPVSENGFEWANSDDDDDEEGDEEGDKNDKGKNQNNKSPSTKSPSFGMLPPLKKPAFIEFSETPRCNGCQSEVIDV
ncbi:unnamed protein product [Cunninghamella blakesleeana]